MKRIIEMVSYIENIFEKKIVINDEICDTIKKKGYLWYFSIAGNRAMCYDKFELAVFLYVPVKQK